MKVIMKFRFIDDDLGHIVLIKESNDLNPKEGNYINIEGMRNRITQVQINAKCDLVDVCISAIEPVASLQY